MSIFLNGVEQTKVFHNGVEQTSVWHNGVEYPLTIPDKLTTSDTDPFGDGSLVGGYNFNSDATDYVGAADGVDANVSYIPAKFSNGASFDGVVYISLNNSPFDTRVNWAASMFLNVSDLSFTSRPFVFNRYANSYVALQFDTGKLRLYSSANNFATEFVASENVDYHVVITSDGTNDSMYVDGVLISQVTTATNENVTNGLNFIIGANRLTTGNQFKGTVDQLMLFNRGLTVSEITALYNMVEPALLTTNTDPFNDGSLIETYLFNSDYSSINGTKDGSFYTGSGTLSVGKFGKAIDNTGVQIPTDMGMPSNASCAISAWYYPRSHGDHESVIGDFRNQSNAMGVNIVSHPTSGSYVVHGGVNSSENAVFGTLASLNTWHHVVLSREGATGYTLYIDGVVSGTPNQNISTLDPAASTTCTIGVTNNSITYLLDGLTDQVMTFNKALSQAEVTALYNMVEPTLIIKNGSFDTDLSDWDVPLPNTIWEAGQMKIYRGAESAASNGASQPFVTDIGTEYLLTFTIASINIGSLQISLSEDVRNGVGVVQSGAAKIGSVGTYTSTFTATTAVTVLTFLGADSTSAIIYIDDVSVV